MADSRESTLRRSIVTSIEPSTTTGDTPNQNNSSPALRPHPRDAGLGDDKLAAAVDLHRLVPVILLDVADIADTTPHARVCHQDRDGLVPGCNDTVAQDVGDEGPRRLARG